MMPDREKVIHAVETAFDVWIDEYTGCSWFKEDEVRQAQKDALALLKEQEEDIQDLRRENHNILTQFHEWAKEQEAVKPFSDDDGAYWCSSCHEDIVWHQKFCSNCGRPVLWKGR